MYDYSTTFKPLAGPPVGAGRLCRQVHGPGKGAPAAGHLSNYGLPMGLAALSDFHLAAAHGGSRGRLRISTPPLFGPVADRPIRTTAIRLRCGLILSTSSSLPAFAEAQTCAILLAQRAVAPALAEADTQSRFRL